MNNEDKIIAMAFVKIKQGILNENWNLIIEAYEDISGEKLELPKKQISRLESIRSMLSETKESTTPVVISSDNKKKMTIIETAKNDKELKVNQKRSKSRIPVKRATEISNLDTINKNPNADFRININPEIRKISRE